MFIGQVIFKSSDPVYSPIFNRGGKNMTAYLDVSQAEGTTLQFDVDIEHKNTTEDSWTVAGSFTQITGKGASNKSVTDVKEQLRFKYTLAGTSSNDSWIRVAILPVVWYS